MPVDGGLSLTVDWTRRLKEGELPLAIVRLMHGRIIWIGGKERISKGPPKKRKRNLGFAEMTLEHLREKDAQVFLAREWICLPGLYWVDWVYWIQNVQI